MTYPKRIVIAMLLAATIVFLGTMPDVTISAWSHREHHARTEAIINWLFNDQNHCAKAYISEMNGDQNSPECRNG